MSLPSVREAWRKRRAAHQQEHQRREAEWAERRRARADAKQARADERERARAERRTDHEPTPTSTPSADGTAVFGRHRAAAEDAPREVVNIAWRPQKKPAAEPGAWGMYAARAGVILLGGLMGYVSYWTQQELVMRVKHDVLVASLEAAGPDLGALIFGALGHAQARRGRRALVSRLLSMACVAAAVTMNVLAVGVADIARLAVAVLPPLLYAVASDRLIAVVAEQHRGEDGTSEDDRSAWLILLRWVMGPLSAWTSLRRWVLDEVSPSPGPSRAELRAAAELERAHELATQADGEVQQAREWAETTVGQLHERGRTELDAVRRAHAEEIARLRAELSEAAEAAEINGGTKKQTLLRLYAQLGERGDSRYGDRAYVAEMAAELAPKAGGLHPKTAEKYLREEIVRKESPQINGRGHPAEGDMIGVTG